jgi:2-dehydro-3-deoxyphosphogluconate aldolase / (4S)-4-hydroxy-2-oxoglutarate aldolase
MAKYSKIEVMLKMKETGVVPVFYHPDAEICKKVVTAVYKGGIRLFEFTNRGDFANEVFSEVNKFVLSDLPGMIMGTGSVLDAATANLYIQAGSNFIVSPLMDEETARTCNRRKILWSPGCGSVTEVSKAHELGAELVKIFPAPSVGGPNFIKTILGPMPWTYIMPTGGVEPTRESLSSWFKAGAYCVGLGSNFITSEIIKNKDFALLEESTRNLITLVENIRK